MSERIFWFALYAMLLALSLTAKAQQTGQVAHIGNLTAGRGDNNPHRFEALRQGLRELGYVEGKNIVFERRFADGKFDRLPSLAAELVRLNVAVILTTGGISTRAAKEATSTIPIVMAQDNDLSATALSPVWRGLVGILRGWQPLPRS
jgi:putative ABC transport system substrate-binding protein